MEITRKRDWYCVRDGNGKQWKFSTEDAAKAFIGGSEPEVTVEEPEATVEEQPTLFEETNTVKPSIWKPKFL